MKIYDEGTWLSHVDLEVKKSERYGYPFSLVMICTVDDKKASSVLLAALVNANYRATDIVACLKPEKFILLLNHTGERGAGHWRSRLIQSAVRDYNIPVMSAVETYKHGDTREKLLLRLENQLFPKEKR